MKKFSMNIPEDLHRRLKHWCVDNDIEMGELIRRLIEEFLPKDENDPAMNPLTEIDI